MADGIGARYFLFEADGALRRLPRRVVGGLIHGEDRLPQYAGQRLRLAHAVLRLRDGVPTRMAEIVGGWWEFDRAGGIRASLLASTREAFDDAADQAADPPSPDGNVVALDAFWRWAPRAEGRRWPWQPTPRHVAAIVEAIWPEAAPRGRGPRLRPRSRAAPPSGDTR
jgi:hypothetical protein